MGRARSNSIERVRFYYSHVLQNPIFIQNVGRLKVKLKLIQRELRIKKRLKLIHETHESTRNKAGFL